MSSETKKRALSEVDVNIGTHPKKAKHGTTDYHQLVIAELKAELKSRKMKVGGTKVELVQRLQQADGVQNDSDGECPKDERKPNYNKGPEPREPEHREPEPRAADDNRRSLDEVKAELPSRDTGHEVDEMEICRRKFQEDGAQAAAKYDAMRVPEIKEELKARGMLRTGSRPDLVQRLREADFHSYLPFKQIVEAAARERREASKADCEEESATETSSDEFKRSWETKEEVVRRGPKAKPLCDEFGYELDFHKIANRPKSFNRSFAHFERMNAELDRQRLETQEKANIMQVTLERGHTSTDMDWVVARDLEIPMHMVEISDFEEWKKRGFTVKQDPDGNIMADEERDKFRDMMVGSAYRKYSQRG